MDLLELDAESVSEMKAFYQEELAKAIRRIDHINKVLTQLGAPGAQLELRISDDISQKARLKSTVSKRKYKKKRGPKSKWDKVILKTLKQAGKPLSYDELTDFLMISEAREPSKRVNTKATVQNTVFRLRHENRIRTFSLGARTKYIAPADWFEGGEIKKEYQSKISTTEKKSSSAQKRGPGRPPKKRGPGRPPKSASVKKNIGSKSSKKDTTSKLKASSNKRKSTRSKKVTSTNTKRSATKAKTEQTKARASQTKRSGVKKKASTKSSKTPGTERKFLIKKTVKK